jgi:HAL2 family 3'(2'),5'-bisphosphate nucleotidase
MIDLSNPDIIFAMQAVRQAALLVKQIQAEMVSPALTKGDQSPVTVADFSSQALIGGLLAQQFPQDALIAEESSDSLRLPENAALIEQITGYVGRCLTHADKQQVCEWIDKGKGEAGQRYWVLDPIDGTKGFLRGDQYVVALALIENRQVQIGVLGCPNLVEARTSDHSGEGSLVIARRGHGAWTTPLTSEGPYLPLHVSAQDDPAQTRILRSFEDAHTNSAQIDRLAQILQTEAAPVRLDSQAKYAMLASGQGEISLRMLSAQRKDFREYIWDQAAGSIVVEEAGGKITDLDGKPFEFAYGRNLSANRGVLASNGLLHDAALEAVKEAEKHG